MASIRKRGDRQWFAEIRYKGYPTKRKTFDTKVQAEQWVAVIESEMARGIFIDRSLAEKITLKEIIDRYLKEVTPTKKGKAEEKYRLERLKLSQLSNYKLAAISPSLIAKYRDERRKAVQRSTVNRELNLIGHVILVARIDWGISISENPVFLIRKLTPPKPRQRRLEPEEQLRLFEALKRCRSCYIGPLVEFSLETAMRRGETLSLSWRNIDFTNRVAIVEDSKNGESRTVPLSPKALNVLEALPQALISGKVFDISADAVKKAFTRACNRANIKNFHFHDLRHEATTRLFEKGLSIMEVPLFTGHKDLRMLERYTHLRASEIALKLWRNQS